VLSPLVGVVTISRCCHHYCRVEISTIIVLYYRHAVSCRCSWALPLYPPVDRLKRQRLGRIMTSSDILLLTCQKNPSLKIRLGKVLHSVVYSPQDYMRRFSPWPTCSIEYYIYFSFVKVKVPIVRIN